MPPLSQILGAAEASAGSAGTHYAASLLQVRHDAIHGNFTHLSRIASAVGHRLAKIIPVNSAPEHTGADKIDDVLLLVAVFAVIGALFGILQLVERQRHSDTEPGKPDDLKRLGSIYNLEGDANQRVTLTTALNRSEEEEGTVLQNVLAGFSTAMAALPDAISFSFITGSSPMNGIWAGCFMGVSAALIGGRPGMISSASAATAVVLCDISLDPKLGLGPMALCVFVVGVLQLIAAALRLSRFITMIPHSVMLGFVNGLAIVMIKAQMRQFRSHGDGPWVEKDVIISMVVTAIFAMAVAVIWARIPKASKIFPAPLASLILTGVFSAAMKDVLPHRSLQDIAGAETFRGGLSAIPSWDFPPVGVKWEAMEMWGKVISTAVRFAIVGLLESLMTQALIDQITGTSGSMRRECLGQGVGNIVSSLYGTQGGCTLIAQSLLNVGSGGRSRVSGLVMGITLGCSVVLLSPIMAHVPVAALVGLIVLIALNTFAWGSLSLILRINWIDAVVVVLVTAVTVWKDLCIAVIAGLVINALGFSWVQATQVHVDKTVCEDSVTIYVRGPLFFGSALNYKMEVNPQLYEQSEIILDFSESSVLDISGTNAIKEVRESLVAAGKHVVLRGLSQEVLSELSSEAVAADPAKETPDSGEPGEAAPASTSAS